VTAACINPLREPLDPARILVIRLGAVGDVLRTLPAFGDLRDRHPGAHLAWLVEPKAASAVQGQPGVDEVIVFPRDELQARLDARHYAGLVRDGLGFVRSLRARRFDLVIDFHGILKSGLLSRASGAPERVSYAAPFAREGAGFWATHRVRLQPRHTSRFVRNAALVDFLGRGKPTIPRAEAGAGRGFQVDPVARAKLRAEIPKRGEPMAVIHPGTSVRTPFKRYPMSAWAEVARGLAAAGVHCMVAAGSDAERLLALAVVDASGGCARPAPRTDSLGDLAALFEACDLFLGSDSGPLHLASLVGTPVVQLLGPTDPVENRPWPGTPSRSLRVPVGCSPCRRGCAAASCMQVIPVEAVIEASRSLLQGACRPEATA